MAYNSLASLYDKFAYDFDYDAWADFYIKLIRSANPNAKEVCDLGCGTGSIAVRLAKAGFKVTALDLSEDMLQVASDKARKWGVRISFARQDMRDMSLPHKTDAIISACDCVNYLTDAKSVKRFLESARRALKPDGALAFDMSSIEKLTETARTRLFAEDMDDESYIWQNEFDNSTSILRMRLALFEKTSSGLYRKSEEEHVQRAHSVSEMSEWLNETGFNILETFGGDTGTGIAPGGKRVYFLCAPAKG